MSNLSPDIEVELWTRQVKALESIAEGIQELLRLKTRDPLVTEIIESGEEQDDYEKREKAVLDKVKELKKSGQYEGWLEYDLRKRAIQLLKW